MIKTCLHKSRSSYDSMLESFRGLAVQLQAINQQAVREYAPVVDALVRDNSCDVRTIEQTLDGLLSFCAYEPALQLYKKLCRHYYTINPAATAEYVHAYKEMWDEEEKAPCRKKNGDKTLQSKHGKKQVVVI